MPKSQRRKINLLELKKESTIGGGDSVLHCVSFPQSFASMWSEAQKDQHISRLFQWTPPNIWDYTCMNSSATKLIKSVLIIESQSEHAPPRGSVRSNQPTGSQRSAEYTGPGGIKRWVRKNEGIDNRKVRSLHQQHHDNNTQFSAKKTRR